MCQIEVLIYVFWSFRMLVPWLILCGHILTSRSDMIFYLVAHSKLSYSSTFLTIAFKSYSFCFSFLQMDNFYTGKFSFSNNLFIVKVATFFWLSQEFVLSILRYLGFLCDHVGNDSTFGPSPTSTCSDGRDQQLFFLSLVCLF